MIEKVTHYLKEDKATDPNQYDMEADWKGLRYSKFEGLEDRGKRKNVYTESYAESDTLRVWQGSEVTREATTLTLTLYFVGEDRDATYYNFYETIKNGKWYYWDTKRLKKAYIMLVDAYSISEDVYKGSTPYKCVKIKFQNLWGECKPCTADGNLIKNN